MFDKFIKKAIRKAVPYVTEIRECHYCGYESDDAEQCPKCLQHSFVTYSQELRKIA